MFSFILKIILQLRFLMDLLRAWVWILSDLDLYPKYWPDISLKSDLSSQNLTYKIKLIAWPS